MVDVGIEPTTKKPMVCRRRHLLRNYWGISPFDHLQRLTNSLPKLSLTTLGLALGLGLGLGSDLGSGWSGQGNRRFVRTCT